MLLVGALWRPPTSPTRCSPSGAGGLPYLIKQVLGETLGKVFLGASAVAVFICTLAVQANTARILFAMARDRAVPVGVAVAAFTRSTQSPHIGGRRRRRPRLPCSCSNINFEQAMMALVCVSIVWANLAYLLTTASLGSATPQSEDSAGRRS